jgi:hypothetical protein
MSGLGIRLFAYKEQPQPALSFWRKYLERRRPAYAKFSVRVLGRAHGSLSGGSKPACARFSVWVLGTIDI